MWFYCANETSLLGAEVKMIDFLPNVYCILNKSK